LEYSEEEVDKIVKNESERKIIDDDEKHNILKLVDVKAWKKVKTNFM